MAARGDRTLDRPAGATGTNERSERADAERRERETRSAEAHERSVARLRRDWEARVGVARGPANARSGKRSPSGRRREGSSETRRRGSPGADAGGGSRANRRDARLRRSPRRRGGAREELEADSNVAWNASSASTASFSLRRTRMRSERRGSFQSPRVASRRQGARRPAGATVPGPGGGAQGCRSGLALHELRGCERNSSTQSRVGKTAAIVRRSGALKRRGRTEKDAEDAGGGGAGRRRRAPSWTP